MTQTTLREFGNTGLRVSSLGFGGSHIGGNDVTGAEVQRLLYRAIDLGINLIDTARSYDASEERIGQALGARRKDVLLSTKIGYGIPGHADWTAGIIPAAITEALRLLKTDYLDIVHLHSCPVPVLEHSGAVEALQREVSAGRIRIAAYSGDNEAVEWAVASGAFNSVQCSFNICDQRPSAKTLPSAIAHQLGVIAKRPLANAPWLRSTRPEGDASAEYWRRFGEMKLREWNVDWHDAALRFTAFTPGVHTCIVGTRNLAHLESNLAAIERGPLDPALHARIKSVFQATGAAWDSKI